MGDVLFKKHVDKVVLDGNIFLSAARLADVLDYSRDYIGQLCRKKTLSCKMVSGVWYVDQSSATNYFSSKKLDLTAFNNTPESLKDYRTGTFITDNQDEFISTTVAAKISGYTQDYIGQLARKREISAKKIGRKWFVAKDELLLHRKSKDEMFREVQAKSAGLDINSTRKTNNISKTVPIKRHLSDSINFPIKYESDTNSPLIPLHTNLTDTKNVYLSRLANKSNEDTSSYPENATVSKLLDPTQNTNRRFNSKDKDTPETMDIGYTRNAFQSKNHTIARHYSIFSFIFSICLFLLSIFLFLYSLIAVGVAGNFLESNIFFKDYAKPIQNIFWKTIPQKNIHINAS